jgi:hypothetical protein
MFWVKPMRAAICSASSSGAGRQGISRDGPGHDRQGETALPVMEKPMRKSRLPKTDSIKRLAEFWDSHDLTDFQDELEEVAAPVFVPSTAITVPLQAHEADAVARLAAAKGISSEDLIRAWVLQKVARRATK